MQTRPLQRHAGSSRIFAGLSDSSWRCDIARWRFRHSGSSPVHMASILLGVSSYRQPRVSSLQLPRGWPPSKFLLINDMKKGSNAVQCRKSRIYLLHPNTTHYYGPNAVTLPMNAQKSTLFANHSLIPCMQEKRKKKEKYRRDLRRLPVPGGFCHRLRANHAIVLRPQSLLSMLSTSSPSGPYHSLLLPPRPSSANPNSSTNKT